MADERHDVHGMDGHDTDCTDAVAQLYEYLDGELDAGTMAIVAGHLRDCSPCLEAFDFQAELRKVVASKCAETMPEEVRSKLLALVEGTDADTGAS